MADLRDLYQEVILEHSKAPRNYRRPATVNRSVEGYNPLCGDHFTLFLDFEGDRIRDIGFQGAGCAISKASASMMTQSVKGKTREEALKIFENFHDLVTGMAKASMDVPEMGKLSAFSGVCEFPVRVKCATLAWRALQTALEGNQTAVSSESAAAKDQAATTEVEAVRSADACH
ncbi:MAG: Fe-S cluster assembly sulfur transfer protein SufU [Terracidiphilus sp.]